MIYPNMKKYLFIFMQIGVKHHKRIFQLLNNYLVNIEDKRHLVDLMLLKMK